MKNVVTDISNQPEHKFVGAGLNAYVHKTDNQHSLDQVHRTANPDEGTNVYLNFLRTHPKLYNNTFFPRVKDMRTSSHDTVTMDIERLHPFTTPGLGDNIKLLTSLWQQYFRWRLPGRARTNDEEYIDDLRWSFLQNLRDAVSSGSGVIDPQLMQAHHVISHIKYKYHQTVDIHANNIIWRLTGVGPQLVITDPLWGGFDTLDPV